MTDLLDFNTAPRQSQLEVIDNTAWEARLDRLRGALADRATDLVREIFPRARIHAGEARVGDVDGSDGESMSIGLAGERAGLWHDHATGGGGDLITLWMLTQRYGDSEFKRAVEDLEHHLGLAGKATWTSPVKRVAEQRQKVASALPKADHSLGAPVASWHYMSADGVLLAIVRRYDLAQVDEATGKRKKTFRPFRADGSAGMPDPRPLYRLPKINTASVVVLVEGEKCADALERVGVEATTVMGGAKSDPNKTDWTPLAGKTVLVWEDNDVAGAGLTERVRPFLEAIGCTVSAVAIPAGKPDKWDAADAVEAGEDIAAILQPPPATQASRFTFLTLRQLRDLKPPEWRIEGIFPVHGASVIYGAYESFKTFVALDMLLSLAAGREWMGRPSKPCGVLYIAGEGQHGLAPRTTGWLNARDISDDIPFLVLPQAVALPTPGDIEDLCRAIDALPWRPGVIALDTITRMSGGGSLNDEKDVQSYVRGMDALRLRSGAHIMNIGHSGKASDKGLFGSIVLPGAVETIICVERKGDRLKLINQGPKGKQKDGPNFDDIALCTRKVEFDQGGAVGSTLILQPDDEVVSDDTDPEKKPARRLGRNQEAVVTALEQAARGGQALGFTRLMTMTNISDRGTLGNALRALVQQGVIHEVGDGECRLWKLA